MTANQRILACVVAGILWLAAIIAKHFWPDIDIGAFMMACAGVITALGVHGAATGSAPLSTLVQTPAPAPAVAIPGQTGRSLWAYPLLLMVIALGLSMLAGCAGFTVFQQALVGYEGAAYSGLKQINDNKLNVTAAALCEGTSIGAAQRNPSRVAMLKAACLSGDTDPNSLFDNKQQPITINVTVPAPAAAASAAH